MNPSEENAKNVDRSAVNVQFKTPLPHKFTRILETPKTPELFSLKFGVSRATEPEDPLKVKLTFDNTDQLKPVEDLLDSVKRKNDSVPFKHLNSLTNHPSVSQELQQVKDNPASRSCLPVNSDVFKHTPKETFRTNHGCLGSEVRSSATKVKNSQPFASINTPLCPERPDDGTNSRSTAKSTFTYPRQSSKSEEERKKEYWAKIRSLAQRQLMKKDVSSEDEDENENKGNKSVPDLPVPSHLPVTVSHKEPGLRMSKDTPRNFIPSAKQKRTPLSVIWQPPLDNSKQAKLSAVSDIENAKQQHHPLPLSAELNKCSKPASNVNSEGVANHLSQAPKEGKQTALNCDTLTVNSKVYRVINILGKGGTSKVFEAFEEESRVLLAIKVIDLSMVDQGSKIAYRNEVDFLIKLKDCQRVIHMIDYEYKEVEQMLYIVMEKGDSDMVHILRDVASGKELFTEWQIRFYWSHMLKAVNEIHEKGIIHADLKPANFIMVKGELKLIDFGIASALHSDMTSVVRDTQIGTINYMSPESLIASSSPSQPGTIKVRQKSDVWALGCILYNLTYGYTPFQSIKNLVGKMQAITNPNHQIPFPQCSDVFLLDVLKKCLERDPAKRPTIQQLLSHPYLTLPSGNVQFLMESLKLACSPNTLVRVSQALQPARDL